MNEVWGYEYANHPDVTITQWVPALTCHTVLYKYVQLLYAKSKKKWKALLKSNNMETWGKPNLESTPKLKQGMAMQDKRSWRGTTLFLFPMVQLGRWSNIGESCTKH